MKFIYKIIPISLLVISISFLALFSPGKSILNEQVQDDGAEAITCSTLSNGEDVKIGSRFFELLFGKKEEKEVKEVKKTESKQVLLVSGGCIFGAKIKQSHITVSDPGNV